MEIINRIAVILTPRRRFFEWFNALDVDAPMSYDERTSLRTAFLVVGPDDATLDEIVDENWEDLFHAGLSQWVRDASRWPRNRTAHIFRDYYEVDIVDWLTDLDPAEPFTVAEQMRTRCAACDTELGDAQCAVALQSDGRIEHWTAEQMDAWSERADDGKEGGDEVSPVVIALRCCSAACAQVLEANFERSRTEQDG